LAFKTLQKLIKISRTESWSQLSRACFSGPHAA